MSPTKERAAPGRYYHLLLRSGSHRERICVRADTICLRGPGNTKLKLDGEIVAETSMIVEAWWIEERAPEAD